MMEKKGKQSIWYEKAPYIIGAASVAGPKEIDGPMARFFDRVSEDGRGAEDSREEGQSRMVAEAVPLAAGYAENVIAEASSHYGTAEKQFRFPLEYGNQRPLSATWTVTGSGAFVVSDRESDVCIRGITTGKIVDYGVKDSLNMGACMAPAAADVIYQNLQDFGIKPTYYDRIITGDLGKVGKTILIDLLKMNNIDISSNHMDCGIEIFDNEEQDTHSGGSGCGCSATVLAGYILKKVSSGEWKRVLFVPTGALLSTVSFNEGQSIPGIAHAVMIEHSGK